ncbi:hypothetical protein ExPEC_2515 [Escherichia coli]|nr:hypothetical protein ExPEC_2515 [Escherichia coli]
MRPVYPRWRGELLLLGMRNHTLNGLSPLARGTLYAASFSDRSSRFIPAGAGNTDLPAPLRGGKPVYPRWRGEHGLLPCFAGNPHGLSPLARGTHQQPIPPMWR